MHDVDLKCKLPLLFSRFPEKNSKYSASLIDPKRTRILNNLTLKSQSLKNFCK